MSIETHYLHSCFFTVNSYIDKLYVGMTARTVGTRVDEHVWVSYRTGAHLTQPPHSAIRDHRDNCGTPFDTKNF